MCGIVGALAFDKFDTKAQEKMRQEAIIFITTQLLQETVERGKDATGVSLIWNDGNYTGLKMGIPAPDFISRFGEKETDFEGLLKIWREYPKKMQIFLGHCRKSSVGNSYDNKNNHPIQVGDILMVHNGTLTNHDVIFDKLDCHREGEVDSEAIARLLHHYTKEGTEPFTTDILKETAKRLEGTYSVLAANGNNPYQVAQFRDGKPAEAVLVRPLKTVFIASEEKFLKKVLFEFNKMGKLFAPMIKFPCITKADCDFKMLVDDSMSLWDLTVPVEDKTEISDLFDWEKTTPRGQKVWRSKSTYSSGASTGTGTGAKKTEVNASSIQKSSISSDDDDDDGDSADSSGLLWSNSLNRYKTQEGIDKTKDMGAVEIDTESGDVKAVDKDSEVDIKEVDAAKVENLYDNSAEVDELKIKNTKEAIGYIKDAKKSKTTSSDEGNRETDVSGNDTNNWNIEGSDVLDRSSSKQNIQSTQQAPIIKEIDMSQHPDAMKKAEEYVEKGLMKYENEDEVVDALDVGTLTGLRNLPMHALANRIKRFIFKEAFIAGYIAHKSGGSLESKELERKIKEVTELKASLLKAEKVIALLKMAARIMGKVISKSKTSKLPSLIDKVIEDILKPSNRLDNINFDKVFTKGDLRSIPMLKDIKKRIETRVKEVTKDGSNK